MFEFTNNKEDFDRYVESKGLSVEYGKKTKVKYLYTPPYYERTGKPKYSAIVDPKKIVGYSRSEVKVGETIYNNIFNLCPSRYKSLLSALDVSVEEFYYIFLHEQSMKISVVHLLDTDEYIVQNDGNHRCSLAACLSLPGIYVAEITDMKCNEETKRKYEIETSFREKYHIEKITIEYKRLYIFLDYDGKACQVIIDSSGFSEMSFDSIIQNLSLTLDKMMKRVKWLEKLPKWILKWILVSKSAYNYMNLIEGYCDEGEYIWYSEDILEIDLYKYSFED